MYAGASGREEIIRCLFFCLCSLLSCCPPKKHKNRNLPHNGKPPHERFVRTGVYDTYLENNRSVELPGIVHKTYDTKSEKISSTRPDNSVSQASSRAKSTCLNLNTPCPIASSQQGEAFKVQRFKNIRRYDAPLPEIFLKRFGRHLLPRASRSSLACRRFEAP